jgi:hypothetical protein
MALNIQKKIELKAHQIWLAEGCQDNRAMDHWLQAEEEICAKKDKVKRVSPVKKSAQLGII